MKSISAKSVDKPGPTGYNKSERLSKGGGSYA